MKILAQTPTISTSAYTAGDAVGGKLIFSGTPDDALVHSVTIIDKDGEGAELDLVLFSEDFTPTADADAFSVNSADEDNIITVINFSTYRTLGSGLKVAVKENLSIPFELSDLTQNRARLYGQLITRGTPTYGATSDLVVKLSVLPYRG